MRIRDILRECIIGFFEATIFVAFCLLIAYGLPLLDILINTEPMQ